MITYIDRRYYRGYSLKQRSDGQWDICWGEVLSSASSLTKAEAQVDDWVENAA